MQPTALPSGEQLAQMTPEQIKGLVNALNAEKAALARQVAVYETELRHHEAESNKVRQELINLTGSDDLGHVQEFIAAKIAEAADALNRLAALYQTSQQTEGPVVGAPVATPIFAQPDRTVQ